MASNSISSHRVDAALTGFLADAGPDEKDLIAEQFVPEISVDSKRFSGKLYSMPLATYMGDGSKIGTDGLKMGVHDAYPEIHADYTPTKTDYECEARGGSPRKIPDVEADRWDFAFTQHEQWAALTRRTIMLDFEYDTFNNQIFVAANWPDAAIGALTGGAGIAWDAAGSKPVQDGLAMRDAIRLACGTVPDYGALTYDVLQPLRLHQDTLRAFGTSSAGLTVVEAMNVPDDKVLAYYAERWYLPGGLSCTKGLYNAANAGQASMTVTEIASAKVWFGCKRGVMGSGLRQDGVGLLGGGPVSVVRIREKPLQGFRWRSENPAGEHIAAQHSYTYVRPSDMASTAYLLTGVVT